MRTRRRGRCLAANEAALTAPAGVDRLAVRGSPVQSNGSCLSTPWARRHPPGPPCIPEARSLIHVRCPPRRTCCSRGRVSTSRSGPVPLCSQHWKRPPSRLCSAGWQVRSLLPVLSSSIAITNNYLYNADKGDPHLQTRTLGQSPWGAFPAIPCRPAQQRPRLRSECSSGPGHMERSRVPGPWAELRATGVAQLVVLFPVKAAACPRDLS